MAFWVWFDLSGNSKGRRGWCHSDHLENPAPILDTRFKDIKPVERNVGRAKDPRVRFTGDRAVQCE